MRLRILVATVVGTTLLVAPTAASAKGPDAVTLTGPGLDAPVRIDRGPGATAQQVSALSEAAHLYTAFGYPAAEALSPIAPPGERGPRYVVTYSKPRYEDVHQHLYPVAEDGGLRLDVMVAIGSDASSRRQEQAYRILDTLTVERPPSG